MCETQLNGNGPSTFWQKSLSFAVLRTAFERITPLEMSAWLVRIGIRRIAWLLCLGIVVSLALAWVISVMFSNERLDRYVAQEESHARNNA